MMQEAKYDFHEAALGGERGQGHSLQPRPTLRTCCPGGPSLSLEPMASWGRTDPVCSWTGEKSGIVSALIRRQVQPFQPQVLPHNGQDRLLEAAQGPPHCPRALDSISSLPLKFLSISMNLASRQSSEATETPWCV